MHITGKRLRHGFTGVAFGCALLFSGCAATQTNVAGVAPAGEASASQEASTQTSPISVESIAVVGNGDRVLIGTTGTVKYTVFRLTDPPRLIVDMPGVETNNITAPYKVDNGYITEINAISYGGEEKIGRITIGLKEGVDHELKSGENSILVSLSRDMAAADGQSAAPEGAVVNASAELPAETGDAVAGDADRQLDESLDAILKETDKELLMDGADEPATDEAATGEDAADEAPAAEEKPMEAPALAEATGLVTVTSAGAGNQTIIRIVADGMIGNYNAFDLDKPSRIVLDIWGLKNETGKQSFAIDAKEIDKVRIGRHPDKLRLVFDSGLSVPPVHTIKKAGDTIIITVARAAEPAVEEAPAAPVAMEPAIEKAPSMSAEAATEPLAYEGGAEEMTPAEKSSEEIMMSAVAPAPPAPSMEPTSTEASAPEAAQMEPVEPRAPEMPAMEPAAVAPEAPAKAAMAPVDTSVDVRDITFEKLFDKARLTIVTTDGTEYKVKESEDGKTLAIDVMRARLPKELQRTLDANKLKTTVTAISSYQESVQPDEVRVLVKLTEPTHYDIMHRDGKIIADFPLVSAKAETKMAEEKKAMEAAMAKKEPAAEAPPAVTAEAGETGEQKYTGKKIDLDMTDANIRDILRLMAEVSNLNIIASDDVAGTVTLRLKNVPWDQAFDLILKSKGLDKLQIGNVVRVAPAAVIRQENQQTLATQKAEESLEPLGIHFIPINYATAANLIPQVKNVLSSRGTITSEERTNTLIIKDIKKNVDDAMNLISKLDTAIPQVLIEARIVEAQSNFARDLGIQWGVDYQAGGSSKYTTDVFGSSTTIGQTPPADTNPPAFATRHGSEHYAVNLPITAGQAGPLGALGFVFGKAGANPLLLDLRLSAGEQQGKLKTISRPRITTLDNKQAKIEQGTQIPYQTTSAAGTATTFVNASLSLTVTPHITPDGSVLMKITASRDSVGSVPTGATAPSINKKEASTEVLVRNGETTVIGGIVISESNKSTGGIPFLKDIPVLGWLFKNRSVSDGQTELLIFITPTIIKEHDKIVG